MKLENSSSIHSLKFEAYFDTCQVVPPVYKVQHFSLGHNYVSSSACDWYHLKLKLSKVGVCCVHCRLHTGDRSISHRGIKKSQLADSMQVRHGNSISSTKSFLWVVVVSANARNPRIRCNFSRRIGSQKRNLRSSELNLGICKPYTWKIVYHHIMNVICKIWHYIKFFIYCVRWKRLGYFILLSFIETLPKLIISAGQTLLTDIFLRIETKFNIYTLQTIVQSFFCGVGLLHVSKNVQK